MKVWRRHLGGHDWMQTERKADRWLTWLAKWWSWSWRPWLFSSMLRWWICSCNVTSR